MSDDITTSVKEGRDIILAALKRLGVKTVIVDWNGEGDSGQVNGVQATDKNGKPITHLAETVTIPVQQTAFVSGPKGYEYHHSFVPKELNLEEALKTFVYDWLERAHPGWENNDGGSGDLTIDVDDDTFHFEHHTYFTDSHTDMEEL